MEPIWWQDQAACYHYNVRMESQNGLFIWWNLAWSCLAHVQTKHAHLRCKCLSYRRKFRNQTSDNMDRWKSKGGKSQKREEKKKEDQRRERVRRKKMQAREKVEKSRNTCVFTMFCGSGGSKSRLAEAAGAPRCGAIWPDKKWKSARRCGAQQIWKSLKDRITPHKISSNK